MILISDVLRDSICQQISHEFYNANLYLYVSGILKNKGLDNLAKHFENQNKEELGHGKMFFSLLTDMNTDVKIPEIPPCEQSLENILEIANLYLEREVLTTESINTIKNLSIDESNSVVEEFLRKMISLQQNEYEESTTFLDKATLTGNDWRFVFMWDLSEK